MLKWKALENCEKKFPECPIVPNYEWRGRGIILISLAVVVRPQTERNYLHDIMQLESYITTTAFTQPRPHQSKQCSQLIEIRQPSHSHQPGTWPPWTTQRHTELMLTRTILSFPDMRDVSDLIIISQYRNPLPRVPSPVWGGRVWWRCRQSLVFAGSDECCMFNSHQNQVPVPSCLPPLINRSN